MRPSTLSRTMYVELNRARLNYVTLRKLKKRLIKEYFRVAKGEACFRGYDYKEAMAKLHTALECNESVSIGTLQYYSDRFRASHRLLDILGHIEGVHNASAGLRALLKKKSPRGLIQSMATIDSSPYMEFIQEEG